MPGAQRADIEEERVIARSPHLTRPREENGSIGLNPSSLRSEKLSAE